VAIGSEGEIGKQFNTGVKDIHYPWVVDGIQYQLMQGDAKVVYICGRPDNVYPRFEWSCQKGCCTSKEYNGKQDEGKGD